VQKKTSVWGRLTRLACWCFGLVALVCLGIGNAHAQITLVATNIVSDAASSFNTAGTIGLSILTFLVGLGAVMMGWRVSRGRGK